MGLISSRKKIKENVLFISGIKVDIEIMMMNSNDLVKESIKKLRDIVEYSDPMSNEMVEMEEQLIMETIVEMKRFHAESNMTEILRCCKKLEDLFVLRNKKLIVTK